MRNKLADWCLFILFSIDLGSIFDLATLRGLWDSETLEFSTSMFQPSGASSPH
jgi:hypothetical protein